ncbi:MAG: hypothetical protein PHV34_23755 [Verrucomicrobiae bacterium]|nr:hypothetical protein [Verrucomicrobiae bacterium]
MDKKPARGVSRVLIDGRWFVLKVPIKAWPKELLAEWKQDLVFLFRDQFRADPVRTGERVCLCVDIDQCSRKKGKGENRGCRWYSHGICAEATVAENEGKGLRYQTLAYFHGLSKQRIQQICDHAQKQLMQAILEDPYLRELCEQIRIGQASLADVEDLTARIAGVLEK